MQGLYVCLNVLKRAAAKAKSKSSAAPAKRKAPLSDKLTATVVSSRLPVKDLEDQL